MNLKTGDAVQLLNTGIPRLEGQRAEVLEVTEWGAHCQCAAAETGRFRAHHSEMVPFDPPPAPASAARAVSGSAAKQAGYTGDCCETCHGSRVKRNGSCLVCEDCGTTSGCS